MALSRRNEPWLIPARGRRHQAPGRTRPVQLRPDWTGAEGQGRRGQDELDEQEEGFACLGALGGTAMHAGAGGRSVTRLRCTTNDENDLNSHQFMSAFELRLVHLLHTRCRTKYGNLLGAGCVAVFISRNPLLSRGCLRSCSPHFTATRLPHEASRPTAAPQQAIGRAHMHGCGKCKHCTNYFRAYVTCHQRRLARHTERSHTHLHLCLSVNLEVMQRILRDRRRRLVCKLHKRNILLGGDRADLDQSSMPDGQLLVYTSNGPGLTARTPRAGRLLSYPPADSE